MTRFIPLLPEKLKNSIQFLREYPISQKSTSGIRKKEKKVDAKEAMNAPGIAADFGRGGMRRGGGGEGPLEGIRGKEGKVWRSRKRRRLAGKKGNLHI